MQQFGRFLPLVALALIGASSMGCHKRPPSGANAYVPPVAQPLDFDPSQSRLLMPLTKGNSWTYEVMMQKSGPNGPGEPQALMLTYTITGVKSNGDRTVATFELSGGNKVLERHSWLETSDGMYQLSAGQNVAFKPAQLLMPFPATAGRKFSWAGRGPQPFGGVGPWSVEGQILSNEPADTAEGPMVAIPISTTSKFGKASCDTTSWFRPGVGMIRFKQEILTGQQTEDILMVLHSHQLKP